MRDQGFECMGEPALMVPNLLWQDYKKYSNKNLTFWIPGSLYPLPQKEAAQGYTYKKKASIPMTKDPTCYLKRWQLLGSNAREWNFVVQTENQKLLKLKHTLVVNSSTYNSCRAPVKTELLPFLHNLATCLYVLLLYPSNNSFSPSGSWLVLDQFHSCQHQAKEGRKRFPD